eukprot:scaffold24448_cov108-Cylindrotheca_fusiformis.AAC.2
MHDRNGFFIQSSTTCGLTRHKLQKISNGKSRARSQQCNAIEELRDLCSSLHHASWIDAISAEPSPAVAPHSPSLSIVHYTH